MPGQRNLFDEHPEHSRTGYSTYVPPAPGTPNLSEARESATLCPTCLEAVELVGEAMKLVQQAMALARRPRPEDTP